MFGSGTGAGGVGVDVGSDGGTGDGAKLGDGCETVDRDLEALSLPVSRLTKGPCCLCCDARTGSNNKGGEKVVIRKSPLGSKL